jgi:hypothetical protein
MSAQIARSGPRVRFEFTMRPLPGRYDGGAADHALATRVGISKDTETTASAPNKATIDVSSSGPLQHV